MRAKVQLRELTAEERATIEKLARSRTEQARLVERAQIILGLADGERPSHLALRLRVARPKLYRWLTRFNSHGLAGLQDEPRSGRPATYSADEVSELIAVALSKPADLELPFASWTLDRLQAYLNEQKGISIKRSRIDEILAAEGLRWRQQEGWFGERVDPEFAEKRGASTASTAPHPKAVL
jgi:transposase